MIDILRKDKGGDLGEKEISRRGLYACIIHYCGIPSMQIVCHQCEISRIYRNDISTEISKFFCTVAAWHKDAWTHY